MSVEEPRRGQPESDFLDSFGPHNTAPVSADNQDESDTASTQDPFEAYVEEILDRSA